MLISSNFHGNVSNFFRACGGPFSNRKSSFWRSKIAKFSACGGPFSNTKPSFWRFKIAKFSACGGPFPITKSSFWRSIPQFFPPAASISSLFCQMCTNVLNSSHLIKFGDPKSYQMWTNVKNLTHLIKFGDQNLEEIKYLGRKLTLLGEISSRGKKSGEISSWRKLAGFSKISLGKGGGDINYNSAVVILLFVH